jgi:TonB family protein
MNMSKQLNKVPWHLGLLLCLTLPSVAEIRVSEADAKKAAVDKPAPTLNLTARQLKLSGKVELSVSIDEQGNVTNVQIANGNPVLGAGAVAAVKKWRFTPFTENGAPAKANTVLTFEFKQ